MRRILTIILFLTIRQNCFATEWAWYYIYIETDYAQGPWTRTDVLDKSGSYKYLHPKQYEELFGSERIDLANAIYSHLQKETESPKRYKFKCSLSLSADTVVIQTKETIAGLDAIKNELTASFTLNNFVAVKIIQQDKITIYQLKDISIPYMDLVFHPDTIVKADIKTPLKTGGIKNDTLTIAKAETSTSKEPENKIPIWLIISIIINLVLTVLLVRKKK